MSLFFYITQYNSNTHNVRTLTESLNFSAIISDWCYYNSPPSSNWVNYLEGNLSIFLTHWVINGWNFVASWASIDNTVDLSVHTDNWVQNIYTMIVSKSLRLLARVVRCNRRHSTGGGFEPPPGRISPPVGKKPPRCAPDSLGCVVSLARPGVTVSRPSG